MKKHVCDDSQFIRKCVNCGAFQGTAPREYWYWILLDKNGLSNSPTIYVVTDCEAAAREINEYKMKQWMPE